MLFYPLTLQDLCYGKDANANGHGYWKVDNGGNGIGNGNEMEG